MFSRRPHFLLVLLLVLAAPIHAFADHSLRAVCALVLEGMQGRPDSIDALLAAQDAFVHASDREAAAASLLARIQLRVQNQASDLQFWERYLGGKYFAQTSQAHRSRVLRALRAKFQEQRDRAVGARRNAEQALNSAMVATVRDWTRENADFAQALNEHFTQREEERYALWLSATKAGSNIGWIVQGILGPWARARFRNPFEFGDDLLSFTLARVRAGRLGTNDVPMRATEARANASISGAGAGAGKAGANMVAQMAGLDLRRALMPMKTLRDALLAVSAPQRWAPLIGYLHGRIEELQALHDSIMDRTFDLEFRPEWQQMSNILKDVEEVLGAALPTPVPN